MNNLRVIKKIDEGIHFIFYINFNFKKFSVQIRLIKLFEKHHLIQVASFPNQANLTNIILDFDNKIVILYTFVILKGGQPNNRKVNLINQQMNNKNKNIRKNILQIVSNRLKPSNPSLQFSKISCHTCLISTEAHDKKCDSQRKNTKINVNKKAQNNLQIYSNIYELVIQSDKQSQLLLLTSNNECTDNQGTQLDRKLKQQSNREYKQQDVKSMIKQWVCYALIAQNKQFASQKFDDKILPLDHHEDLQRLKNMIKQASQLVVFYKQNKKISQSQYIQPESIKKQTNLQSYNKQSISSTVLPYTYSNFYGEPHNNQSNSISQIKNKSNSHKLVESHTTLPSQKVMQRKKDEETYEDLLRMLILQAQSLQQFI